MMRSWSRNEWWLRLNIKKELMEKTNKTESDEDETRIVILVLSSCFYHAEERRRRWAKKKVNMTMDMMKSAAINKIMTSEDSIFRYEAVWPTDLLGGWPPHPARDKVASGSDRHTWPPEVTSCGSDASFRQTLLSPASRVETERVARETCFFQKGSNSSTS